jgi:hypothetical protein
VNRLGIVAAGASGFGLIALASVWQLSSETHTAAAVVSAKARIDASRPTNPAQDGTEPLPDPMLHFEYTGTTVVLSGRIAAGGLRDAIVTRARRLYPTAQLEDRIAILAVGQPTWIAAPFPPDLHDTRQASALLQDGRLLVQGDTRTDDAETRVDAALLEYRSLGLRVDKRLNQAGVDDQAETALEPSAPPRRGPNTNTTLPAGSASANAR